MKFLILLVGLLSILSCKKEEQPILTKQEVVLDTATQLFTVINVLKPDSLNKDQVISLLKNGLNNTMRKQKGFVSSQLHASLDNHYIINYTQWESGEDLQAAGALVGSGGAPNMAAAFSKGNPDYHPYKLIGQYTSEAKPVIIDEEGSLLTIVNILIPKDGVSKTTLGNMLKEALADELVSQSGFISSTIHESIDNNFIINYSQWVDGAALNKMVTRLQSGNAPKLGAAFGASTPDFHPFSIVGSYYP